MIYRGWGILAFLIPICCILITTFFIGVNGNTTLDAFIYNLLGSSPIVYLAGWWLNRRSVNDLYFIPLQYWGLIWAVVAIGVLLFQHLKS